MQAWDYEGARTPGVERADERTSEACALARTAQCEVARLRGWARRGDWERALDALDRALAALAALDRAATREPWIAPAGAKLRAELDALTR